MRNLAEHRRETAIKDLGSTNVEKSVCKFGLIVFSVVLLSVPFCQIVSEISRGELPQVYRAVGLISDPKRVSFIDYEVTLEVESVLNKWLLPIVQTIMTGLFHTGNEQAYLGRDGWLFYRADIDSLLSSKSISSINQHESDSHSSVLDTMVDFKRQLEKQNITLIVMPTPVKPSIHPDKFSKRLQNPAAPIQNTIYAEFIEKLFYNGVLVYDPSLLLFNAAQQDAQYLKTDTHWKPEAMESVAKQLANLISENVEFVNEPNSVYTKTATEKTNIGDIATMLNLGGNHFLFPKEHVTAHVIRTQSGEKWKPERNAEILFLGDSFSNIYSLGWLGWGESAGLVEHLSAELSRPIDKIVINAGGAFATRQTLSKEPERLAGKRVVVYQFASRELFSGYWKKFQIPQIQSKADREQNQATQEITVNATIKANTEPPSPGSVPYKDCIIALHLDSLNTPELPNELIVFMWGMRENRWTEAASYKIGQQVKLRLRSWDAVQTDYESFNRIELEDEETWLLDVYWGELP